MKHHPFARPVICLIVETAKSVACRGAILSLICSRCDLWSSDTTYIYADEPQVKECLEALAAGREWNPATSGRQQLLEDEDGAEMQVLHCTAIPIHFS